MIFGFIFNTALVLYTLYFAKIAKCDNESLLTTITLNNQQERSAAFYQQASFINEVLHDANTALDRYQSVMESNGVQFPPELMQFLLQMNTYDSATLPSTLFVNQFPFTDFQTFITMFPWMSSMLENNSMTDFKVPNDYKTMVITITNSNTETSNTSSSTSSSHLVAPSTKTSGTSQTSTLKDTTSSSLFASSSTNTVLSSTLSSSSSSPPTSSSTGKTVSSISTSSVANGAISLAVSVCSFWLSLLAVLF